ncbi:Fic family protein [Cellulomonas sp. SLBN-39]|uniref:Fic family protein n=1 Tax=Cellulomonas sp. SLBN-39 TaxID=2768446 RepID=UPI001152AEE4|nr:Fic family protein [Cellulomonas sp. SLBN-39]TQL02535.1 Fic family protein [Cellulomonas sp. SLBN-39]
MDPLLYADTVFGRPHRTPGDRRAFWYYSPRPIPRDLDLTLPTIAALSRADNAIGLLTGFGHLVRDPEMLIGPYLRREALASTRIEGTQTTLDDVLRSEAHLDEATVDTQEVWQYIDAARLGMELITALPLSQRLITSVHRKLLSGVRGQERMPGELRRSPVWVGSATDTPDTAQYVPPLHTDLPDLMTDLELFANEPSPYPPLIHAGLLHYQFETIHPFLDGNGRIGRLIVSLYLMQEGRLPAPILYLSGYLEARRSEYYDRLQAVRERGEIQEWLQFFLTAVERQAVDGATRARLLVQKREEYLSEASTSRGRLSVIADLVFQNPIMTVARAQSASGLSNQGARNLVGDAVARGWLTKVGRMSGRDYWIAQDVHQIMQAPLDALT